MTGHRFYFGQLQRLILDAHKANPEARPSQLALTLKKQKVTTTAKYISKTIRSYMNRPQWNGRTMERAKATKKFRRGPAPATKTGRKKTA